MNSSTDFHVELARIQSAIEKHLGMEEQLIFDFSNTEKNVKLNLITVNPRHNQSFLFHSVIGIDKIDALQKMLSYVKSYKEQESPYTIQWRVIGDKELHTSYFRAKNMYDALDKLYYNRDINSIAVYSIVLNPVT
jgi:carbamoylphosphate synthase large subunit